MRSLRRIVFSGSNPQLSSRASTLLIALAWGLCAVYAAIQLDHRFIPHDDGMLAHSAERVMLGELPHADFDEVYTGGESFLNAAAFELLGPRLLTLRIALYVAFLAWVATLLYIGMRFMPPLSAGLTAIAAVVWSMPNYPAAMPSWYNLFFATFGAAALLREAQTGQRRWLWIAGAFAGVSITFKIVGLYFVCAALLYFAYREAGESAERGEAGGSPGATPAPTPKRAFAIFTTACLVLFVGLVLRVVQAGGVVGMVDFVVPIAALAALVVAREWRAPGGRFGPRFRRLLALALPFLGGALIPIAVFVAPYAFTGSLDALYYGLFVLPMKRLDFAAGGVPGWSQPLALGVLAIAVGVPLLAARLRRVAAIALGAIAFAVLFVGGRDPVYQAVFRSAADLVPLAAALAAVLLWRRDARPGGPEREARDGAFLLLAVASTWSLVRYPFAGPLYYFYVIPALILAISVVASGLGRPARRTLAGVIGFYALFAVLWIGTNSLVGMVERRSLPADFDYLPPLERSGLRMTLGAASQYELLVQAVHERARGRYIYATPDSPEVYFLTGMLNPTRTMFDFFDEPEGRAERVLETLRMRDVNVVVIKLRVPFSGRVPPELMRALEERYPNAEAIGFYVVRWRS